MSPINRLAMKASIDHQLEQRVVLALLTVAVRTFGSCTCTLTSVARRVWLYRRHAPSQSERVDGTVTISGDVPSVQEQQTLCRLVRHVPGVIRVIDNVRVVEEGRRSFVPQFAN